MFYIDTPDPRKQLFIKKDGINLLKKLGFLRRLYRTRFLVKEFVDTTLKKCTYKIVMLVTN